MNVKSSSRRTFLKSTAAATVGTTLLAQSAPAALTSSPAKKVRIGLIGCGGRGSSVGNSFNQKKDVEVVLVADPDKSRRENTAKKIIGSKPVDDLRRVLDDKTINAVIVATPDHWHAPASLLAMDAGKHVYVEKPCSHNIREGRLLVEKAEKTGLHVQHGTQSRSAEFIARGIQMLREGVIGKVLVAKAWNVQRRGEIGKSKPSDPPSGFNYDLWVGPAPKVPFRSTCHHYTWHWWYNFGTGDTGNDGVHEIDIARWGLGVETHPSRVSAIGEKLSFDDDQQFPDTQYASFLYPGKSKGEKKQLVFEMRLWSRYALHGIDNGNAFYGTKGWMLLSKRGTLKVFDEKNNEVKFKLPDLKLTEHFENFINVIRGDEKKLHAEIKKGHLSSTLCHLANLSSRLGRSLNFNPKTEKAINDEQADQLVGREYRKGHWATPRT